MTALHANADVRSAKLSAKVIVGPETAARLGVPVGSEVDYGVIASYHRNPVRRFLQRLSLRSK